MPPCPPVYTFITPPISLLDSSAASSHWRIADKRNLGTGEIVLLISYTVVSVSTSVCGRDLSRLRLPPSAAATRRSYSLPRRLLLALVRFLFIAPPMRVSLGQVRAPPLGALSRTGDRGDTNNVGYLH